MTRDIRDPDSYVLTVPGAAAFVRSVTAGRQELLQLLARKKYVCALTLCADCLLVCLFVCLPVAAALICCCRLLLLVCVPCLSVREPSCIALLQVQ